VNPTTDIAFLVDCDNTLLDNDRVQADLRDHLEREFGVESRDRYWAIFEELRVELGYADYLGALQRYRIGDMNEASTMPDARNRSNDESDATTSRARAKPVARQHYARDAERRHPASLYRRFRDYRAHLQPDDFRSRDP
jgi:hypothetical protein